jgi:hypothetical protein
MRRLLATVAVVAGLAALPGGAPAQDTPAPCVYSKAHLAPVKVGALPGDVVPGRKESVRVKPRGSKGTLLNTHLTAISIRFERITDATATFSANLLSAYKKAKPGDNIGYDVQLDADSPGERAIVRWTDANPDQPGQPCSGEVKTGDMQVVTPSEAQQPKVSSSSGASDAHKGDSGLLNIGGKGKGCPLTDASPLTVVATSAGIKRTLKLDMACGDWKGNISAKVDRFTLLGEDGDYAGAARLYVSPRANPTPGAKLSIAIMRGKQTLSTKRFHVVAGPKVVAG